MNVFSFTIDNTKDQFVNKVQKYLSSYHPKSGLRHYTTKDGNTFEVEFEELYQLNKFRQDLASTFPYLFVDNVN